MNIHIGGVPLKLPNELVENILSFLPSRELAWVSAVSRAWRDIVKMILMSRVHAAFGKTGVYQYSFVGGEEGADEPDERILRLPEASRVAPRLAFQENFTIFEFSADSEWSNKDCFDLEDQENWFQKIFIESYIVRTLKDGKFNGIVQHLVDTFTIEHLEIAVPIGSRKRFKVNDQVFLEIKLLTRDTFPSEYASTCSRYEIELERLLIDTVHLLAALERHEAIIDSSF